MSRVDIEQSYTIHLGVSEAELAEMARDALAHGMMVFELQLLDIPDKKALCDYLAKIFRYPHRTVGLDAAVSMISDLEWIGNEAGYVVIVRGATDSSPVTEMFVRILPNILDRWRTQAVPVIFAIDGKGASLQSAVAEENDELDRFGRTSAPEADVHAVPVEVH